MTELPTTPVCYIDETGIHRPALSDVLTYFQTAYRSIYGQDIYIDPDSQDGQFLGLISQCVHDVNGVAVAVYNSFSPSTAEGTGLSSVVKINGIARLIPTYSTATGLISGEVGIEITNGVVKDDNGFLWNLPSSVTIPPSGEIYVTVVCQTLGAITAPIGTITEIETPTPGWQFFENTSAAVAGAPVELDGELRMRQTFSASLPENSTIEGLKAAIADIPGATRFRIYENSMPGDDPILGIPGNSIAVVVDGGDMQTIVDTIQLKKGNGVRTYGTGGYVTTPDDAGITRIVDFSFTENVPVTYRLRIKPLTGFTATIQNDIVNSLVEWTNSLGIGVTMEMADAYMIARLSGDAKSKTYSIIPDSLQSSRDGNPFDTIDIPMAYNEAPYCDPKYILITLVT